ncbi:HTH-type transcriptional regulator DegA [Eubacterium plexicaudatum ASF492]|uniref:HTH lacI-type domain-containing protein n=1 Tax=Eubacterium plexicaudatum ASF492 TaxID=1235802 RepID=N2AQP4_9FIRM|nr:HTH-type transcriptional regulator DegA [Eubacterium plexicaudatum ASF492]
MKKQNATYGDIANYTNLSKMTISRYFNQPHSLADETKEKIEEALKTLDYTENKFAKALSSGKSGIIGIITPNFFYNFYTALIDAFIRIYPKSPYKFLVFTSDNSPETERSFIAELLSYRIEGLIILSHMLGSEELCKYPFPVIGIERESEFISSVDTDNVSGTKQAVKRLLQDGCEVLIHINTGTSPALPSYARIKIFEEVAVRTGTPHQCFMIPVEIHTDVHKLYACFEKVCKTLHSKYPHKRIGAFVCNDTMAHLFLNSALTNGFKVPEQLEIIGFDNSPVSEQAILPISTVGQNVNRIVSQTVRLLDRQLEEKKNLSKDAPTQKHLIIKPKLLLRKTTLNIK